MGAGHRVHIPKDLGIAAGSGVSYEPLAQGRAFLIGCYLPWSSIAHIITITATAIPAGRQDCAR